MFRSRLERLIVFVLGFVLIAGVVGIFVLLTGQSTFPVNVIVGVVYGFLVGRWVFDGE